jgi:hypothetical protein
MNVQSEMTACIAVLALSGMSLPFLFPIVWHSNSVLVQMN